MRLHMEANELFTAVGDVGGAGYALSRASPSAYWLGDLEEAMRLGRAGYDAFSEVNHRWGATAALCRIGFAALSPGDRVEAGERLSRALEQAHAAQATSLELLALSGVGALLAAEGQDRQAAVLLTYALGHEQLPAAYGFAARPALDADEASLPEDELAAAREEAGRSELADLVAETLPRLATHTGAPSQQ